MGQKTHGKIKILMFFLTFQQNYLAFIKKIENFTNNELTVY